MREEDLSVYPEHIAKIAVSPLYFGRMNDPTSAAYVKGPCGDEMEFYLVIDEGVIKEIKFFTDGCAATVACGETTAKLALGRSADDALRISAGHIRDILKGLPEAHSHCPILAVSALYRAIADYLLKI
jgi:nitrogen fixation protein NifU and related proteins